MYGTVTLFRQAFLPVPLHFVSHTVGGPTTPGVAVRQPRFGLLRVRSPLLAQSFLLSFPPGTKMFQFPGFAPRLGRGVGIAPDGFPHSDIRGSQGICPSPRLFAAYHVLLRLREPQASPVRPCSLSFSLFKTVPASRAAAPRRRRRCTRPPRGPVYRIHKTRSIFPISQLKSLDFFSFCVPTMSMISSVCFP